MITLPPTSLALGVVLALVIAAGGGAVGGYRYAAAQGDATLTALKADVAAATAAAEHAALERLQAAQARGDELETQLAQQAKKRAALTKELNREITKNTTGRPCFNDDTLRLLDRAPGIDPAAVSLPAPAGLAFDADAAVATDTQIAGWIVDAATQYDACRARIDALRTWHEGGNDGYR